MCDPAVNGLVFALQWIVVIFEKHALQPSLLRDGGLYLEFVLFSCKIKPNSNRRVIELLSVSPESGMRTKLGKREAE